MGIAKPFRIDPSPPHAPARRRSSSRRAGLLALALALATLGGCGGARPEGAASPSPTATEAEPATIEEAQAELEHARATLEGDPQAATLAAPPQPPRAPEPAEADMHAEAAGAGAADPCATSCRAIGSMRRAVNAICRIAGTSDARCEEARRILATSEERVVSCRCP